MADHKTQTFEELQQSVLGDIEAFRENNPQIVEAMEVMNMAMADYLEVMDSVRGVATSSCSSSAEIPLQPH